MSYLSFEMLDNRVNVNLDNVLYTVGKDDALIVHFFHKHERFECVSNVSFAVNPLLIGYLQTKGDCE